MKSRRITLKNIFLLLLLGLTAVASAQQTKLGSNTVINQRGGNTSIIAPILDNMVTQQFVTNLSKQSPVNTSPIATTIITAPLLYVDINLFSLQSCQQSAARVSYCNHGTATATNVYVDIDLEQVLTLDSASIAYAYLGGNSYRFQVGTVVDSSCGGFDIFVTTDCDTSLYQQEHCIDAHIYPDSVSSAVWNGYLLQSDGHCYGDSIVYTLLNNGPAIYSVQPLAYFIIDDHLLINGTRLIVQQGAISLGTGQTATIPLHNITAGKDYRLEVVDANNNLIVATSIRNCSNTNKGMIQNFNPKILWNGSYVPFSDQACAINRPVSTAPERGGRQGRIIKENITVRISPNPFSDYTRIEMEGKLADKIHFNLYDITGRLVQSQTVNQQSFFLLERNDLEAGIYIYRIETAKGFLAAGKLIVQ